MAWFGYDQGVFSGVLISADFKKLFPQTSDPNISGITSSCFSVSTALLPPLFSSRMMRRKMNIKHADT